MYISHYWKWRITFLWSILAPFKTSELSTLDTIESTLGTQHQTALPTLIWLLSFTEATYMHYCWVYTKNCEHGFRLDPHSSIYQFTGITAIIWLSQYQWDNPEKYGLIGEMNPPSTMKSCISCDTDDHTLANHMKPWSTTRLCAYFVI